jgi:ferritin
MFSQKLNDAFNDQIQKEFFSSYLYLAMAAHFESVNLPGSAKWMKKQADEERAHAMRLWEHVYDRGGKVELKAIEQPKTKYGNPLEIFQEVLDHERQVTASIHALYDAAVKEGDRAAQLWIDWFVNEQVEEEKHATEIVEQLKMSGGQGFGMLFIDEHILGKRG